MPSKITVTTKQIKTVTNDNVVIYIIILDNTITKINNNNVDSKKVNKK